MVKNYVGGEWCGVSHSETLTVTNPASGGEIGRVPLSTGTDVDKAVQAAKTAYPGWRSTPSPERARVLFRLKALLDEHKEDLAQLLTTEHGKSLQKHVVRFREASKMLNMLVGYHLS